MEHIISIQLQDPLNFKGKNSPFTLSNYNLHK